jgi:hypothetical protein
MIASLFHVLFMHTKWAVGGSLRTSNTLTRKRTNFGNAVEASASQLIVTGCVPACSVYCVNETVARRLQIMSAQGQCNIHMIALFLRTSALLTKPLMSAQRSSEAMILGVSASVAGAIAPRRPQHGRVCMTSRQSKNSWWGHARAYRGRHRSMKFTRNTLAPEWCLQHITGAQSNVNTVWQALCLQPCDSTYWNQRR